MALWRWVPPPQRVAALVVLVALGAIGLLPLFGGPGYEQSVASGVVVPMAAAIATALEASGSTRGPLSCALRGLITGAGLAGVAFLTAVVHGLRVGMCDFWGGSLFFVLTAGLGGPLGGLWGAVVAESARRRRRRRLAAVLLALAGPLGAIAISVARFYGSPMIFGYDPFFGYFSGALYDTVVDVRTELWTYRAGTLATITGALLVASCLRRRPEGTLTAIPLRGDPAASGRAALGLVALACSLAITVSGPALGHWQTATTIATALGGYASGPRCDVHHPDTLLPAQVELLVRDCEQELAADERRLGAHLDGRLTAFVFRDTEQKRQLMGAAQTSIAKPWRREVYIQMAGYPHPVLGHEIAHVVAGSFASGPFRVAAVGGLWPNPGLIEGTAEATSPDDDELTDVQWARAMLDLGILPRLRELFSLSFMGENSSKGYTVAAAFVTWVLDRWGAETLRAWYTGGSIESLTGLAWTELEAQFATWLRAFAMPAEAAVYARAKFDRPSVWGRRCPHVVDALDRRADQCRDERRFERARSLYGDALARDPHDWHAQLDRARIETWYGDETRGRADLTRLAGDDRTPRNWRDRAQESLADDDLARGRDAAAAAQYAALAARTLDEDAARTLEVKALAIDNPPARRAVVDLLIGEPGRPVDTWVGALSLGAWADETHEPLAGYLIGKNLALREDWQRAAAWLDRALEAGVPSPRVGRELLRQRGVCACALADPPALERVRKGVQDPGSPFAGSSGGRREWVLRMLARCSGSP